jgi:FAD/FMN-containing dehydrogenase
MNRRRFLAGAATLRLMPPMADRAVAAAPAAPFSRVRPGELGWPSDASWAELGRQVGGRLFRVQSPLAQCRDNSKASGCADLFRELKNPYYIGDQPGLAQTLGWVDAWTFAPSVWAVRAERTADVAAVVDFARDNRLRLVVKGGGHSYLGRSNAPHSLLVWTRAIDQVALHDAFVPTGCDGKEAPQPAVSIGAGAIWGHVYDRVAAKAGRYVQGGGCLTVGVAGLVQAGGFGSFSKMFGTAAASLIEAEIVTADGKVRLANSCREPDLYWALKGGGGGSFGVVTRLTLKTHDLPATVGVVHATIEATSDDAFLRLVARFVQFYAAGLSNPQWGEEVVLRPGRRIDIRMAFQGLDRPQAQTIWQPFFGWVASAPGDFTMHSPPAILAIAGRNLWNPAFLRAHVPQAVRLDDRPGASGDNIFWAGNYAEAGHVIYGYASLWLPQALLAPGHQGWLAQALVAASRYRPVELHFGKGLGGGAAPARAATAATAMNPKVLDAFALAIVGGEGPPAYPGFPGHEPDLVTGRREAEETMQAIAVLRALPGSGGSYFAESDFFAPQWQQSYWGANYPRLLAIKRRYDPKGLFFVHHGVGSEAWSADGFTWLAAR